MEMTEIQTLQKKKKRVRREYTIYNTCDILDERQKIVNFESCVYRLKLRTASSQPKPDPVLASGCVFYLSGRLNSWSQAIRWAIKSLMHAFVNELIIN